MIRGETGPFEGTADLASNMAVYEAMTVGDNERLVRVAAYVDGNGSGAGQQPIRAGLYDNSGVLFAVSEEELVVDGDAAGWRTFVFADAGAALAAGKVTVAVQGGPSSAVTGIYWHTRSAGGRQQSDAWEDGPAPTLPGSIDSGARWAVFLETTTGFVAPDATDRELALLPFAVAQRIFTAGGPITRSLRQASIGFHGAAHGLQGAVAIARSGGPLEDLVGERLRITRRRVAGHDRTIVVAVVTEEEWPEGIEDEDLSISLRAWLELANPAEDSIVADVEVMQ